MRRFDELVAGVKADVAVCFNGGRHGVPLVQKARVEAACDPFRCRDVKADYQSQLVDADDQDQGQALAQVTAIDAQTGAGMSSHRCAHQSRPGF